MTNSEHNPDALSQALAEPSRRAILEQLRLGQKSVTELVQSTGLKQPNVSNHLAKMRLQRIVHAERIGRKVYYSIAMPVADFLIRLHEFTRETLHQEAKTQALSEDRPHAPDRPVVPVRDKESAEGNGSRGRDGAPLPLDQWRDDFFQSVLAGQEDEVQALVHEMLARRVSLPVIYLEIFQWALKRIGELYQQGETDEAHEHLVSALIERMMARVAQFYTPVARMPYRAILGCVAGNWHVVGLRMLSDALRVQGWETLFLGANVPTRSFLAMANSLRPDLVAISCTMKDHSEELRHLVQQLDASRGSLPNLKYRIMIGGQYMNAEPEVAAHIPTDMMGRDLGDFLAQIAQVFPAVERRSTLH